MTCRNCINRLDVTLWGLWLATGCRVWMVLRYYCDGWPLIQLDKAKEVRVADHQKRACDSLVMRDGPILLDGTVNNAAKLSNQYAATMAALSGKLRLCKSATTRAESAGLKKALQVGPRPWDCDPALNEYFT